MHTVAHFVHLYWLLAIPLTVLAIFRFNSAGHKNIIRIAVERQGVRLVRIRPVKFGEHELNLAYARTRGGGRYYSVTGAKGDVLFRQTWIVEDGAARWIEGVPASAVADPVG